MTASFDDWFASLGYEFLDIDTGLDAWRRIMNGKGGEIFALNGWAERIFSHLDVDAGLLRSSQADVHTAEPAEPARYEPALTNLPVTASDAARKSAPIAASAPFAGSAKEGIPGGLQDALAAIIRELLKLDEFDPHSPFASLGLDSVMAIRLIVLVEQRLSRRLTPKELLQYPSAAALAGYMLSRETTPAASDPAPPDEPDAIAAYLASTLKRMLRADEISPDAKFGQLGVDSIMAVKLASEFDKRFAVGISPRWFIDFPTVDRLAREIESRRLARPLSVPS